MTFTSVAGNWAAVTEAEAYVKESYAESELPEYDGVLQTPQVSCVGGCIYDANGNLTDTLSAVTDGNLKTEWRPFANESTQTILLDMKEEKQLFGLDLILGPAVSPFDFRVMGSVNGEDWRILSDTGISGLKTYKAEKRNALSARLSGVYRYIKVILMGAPSKDTKKGVSELRLYADVKPEEEKTGAVPETDITVSSAESADEKTPDNGKNVLPYIIGAVCAATVAAGVIAAVMTIKKRKRQ